MSAKLLRCTLVPCRPLNRPNQASKCGSTPLLNGDQANYSCGWLYRQQPEYAPTKISMLETKETQFYLHSITSEDRIRSWRVTVDRLEGGQGCYRTCTSNLANKPRTTRDRHYHKSSRKLEHFRKLLLLVCQKLRAVCLIK